MLRPALLAAALATAFPVHADAPLDALRAELQELKSAYETRIQALEERLKATEAEAGAAQIRTAEPREQAAARPADPTRSNAFNPAISLILQGQYAHLDNRDERGISGFFPAGGNAHGGTERGFSIGGSELVISANIDPTFRGHLIAVLADDEVEIEEAWFQTTRLGQGLAIKGGRFRSGLGYQNERHPHAWDFTTNNLVYEALFGEGYGNDGLQLKWVAPTELFMELGAEAGRGASFPGTDRNTNGAGSYALFGHLGGDVGASNSWRAGLSYLAAKASEREGELEDLNDEHAETLFSGKSKIWGADFVWKWAPNGNASEQNFKFAAEYFRRSERGSLCGHDEANEGCLTDTEDAYRSRQSGFYAQGVYQFMPRWRTGYRYDRLNPGSVDFGSNPLELATTDYTPTRHSLMLDYSPSEFSRLRLQYSKDQSMAEVSENQWFVQYIHSLGAHGAHKF
jgi:outer membrane receptor protein involved in Fe transport